MEIIRPKYGVNQEVWCAVLPLKENTWKIAKCEILELEANNLNMYVGYKMRNRDKKEFWIKEKYVFDYLDEAEQFVKEKNKTKEEKIAEEFLKVTSLVGLCCFPFGGNTMESIIKRCIEICEDKDNVDSN